MKTLTEMLRSELYYTEPEIEGEAEANERELVTIKSTFKDWLETVALPLSSSEGARRLLIALVDEP